MDNGALKRHWQMILALLVLTGVLTETQLIETLKTDAPVPDNWQDIVAQINRIKNGEEL